MNTIQFPEHRTPRGLQGLLEKELLQLEMISLDDFTAEAAEIPEAASEPQYSSPDFETARSLEDLLESSEVSASVKDEIALLKSEAAGDQTAIVRKAIEMFNIFDHLRFTLEGGDPEVLRQIRSAVSHSLALLREMGIHEVDVYGQYIDEDYMELLGTIPAEEAPAGLETYQVAAVYRRAFSMEETGKIIQDALVKTVS